MFPMPINPEDLPEPLRSHILSQIDRAVEMEDRSLANAEDRSNRAFQFMMDMRPEQLGTFQWILQSIASSDDPQRLTNLLLGQSDAILRLQYPDLCNHCGRVECSRSAPTVKIVDLSGLKKQPGDDDSLGIQVPTQVDREAQVEVEETLARQALMAEYNVVENPDGPTAYKCGNCGVDIASLEDRMLRPAGPDGCSGCRVKSAHG